MSYIIDIGGAPAEEECAQLGQTNDFEAANLAEVTAYKLAIIARHGLPPEGCKLIVHNNRHDFGLYRTLALRVEDDESEAVDAYAEAVEPGLGHGSRQASPRPLPMPARSPRSSGRSMPSW